MSTIAELAEQSLVVKNAEVAGENTHDRIGDLFYGIVEHLKDFNATLESINNISGSPLDGQVLIYDGIQGKWKYGSISGGGSGSSTLAGLSDVVISNPQDGQALVYNNGAWRNGAASGGGGTATGTFWGRPYNSQTATTVSGQISDTGNVLPSTNNSFDLGSSSKRYRTLYATSINLNGIVITADNNAVHINSKGLYADTFISALGLSSSGGGGGGGTTLLEPLLSINQLATNPATSGYGLIWDGDSWGYGPVGGGGGITLNDVWTSLGTPDNSKTIDPSHFSGVQTTVGPLGSTTKPLYASAAGTFAECSNYAGGTALTINNVSKGGSTASIYVPTSAGSSNGQVVVWDSGTGPVWTNQSNLVAGSANRLSGNDTYTAWGKTYWSNGVPQTITGAMTGVTSINSATAGDYSIGSSTNPFKRIYLGSDSTHFCYLEYDSNTDAVHIVGGGLYTDTFVSALGANSAGGGGGVVLNEPLLSINTSGLAAPSSAQNGKTIVYNSTSGKWEYGTAGGTTLVQWMASLNNASYAPTSGTAGYLHWNGTDGYEWSNPTIGHPASFWGQNWNDTNTAITGNMAINGTISNVTGIYPSSSGSYDLGDSTRTFKRLYLGTNSGNPVYLEYNSTNKAIHIVNAGLYADTYVSALGANSSSGGGGTALNNPLLSINNTLSSNPTSSQINYGLVWNGSSWGYASVVGGSGTVTSVRVQATSPVVSSVDTAQTSTLNTTISLANGYGDTKNPYASKAKNLVLASPASTAGTPSFRKLVSDDIPDLSGTYLKLTGGTMSNANLVTNMNADLLDGKHLTYILNENPNGTFADKPTGYIVTYNNAYESLSGNPFGVIGGNQCVILQCIPGNPEWGSQLAFGFSTPYLAWRNHGGSTDWSSWQKISAGSADQLTTSRSLWGQSFNGTADVNGELKFYNESGYTWYLGYGAGNQNGFALVRATSGGAQGRVTAVMNSSGYLGLGGTQNPAATIDIQTGGSIKIGGGVISWDDVNNCIKITGYNNTVAGIYANGSVSALGFSAGTSSVDAMTFGYLNVNNRLSFKNSSYTFQIYQDSNGCLHIDGSELIKMGNDLNMDGYSITTGNGNIQCGTGNVFANKFYVGNGRYIYLDGTTLKYNDNGTVRTIAFS